MKKEEMAELFRIKISLEQERFKRRMLKQKPENIYASAYRIDCFINIYEALLEMSREAEEDALRVMLAFPDILNFFYGKWLKKADSFHEELRECLDESIESLRDIYQMAEGEKTA